LIERIRVRRGEKESQSEKWREKELLQGGGEYKI